ncbi:Uncharacterized protein TCM_014601 [Theobroma cacao]|uniref:Uncharacterized protein n=1 Tax=Theobroma cacao TaxID=3641 RepID=A0A061G5V4_THECC|nr:Uncharacterized protein TCM_014601 [Theobroma cacao]
MKTSATFPYSLKAPLIANKDIFCVCPFLGIAQEIRKFTLYIPEFYSVFVYKGWFSVWNKFVHEIFAGSCTGVDPCVILLWHASMSFIRGKPVEANTCMQPAVAV